MVIATLDVKEDTGLLRLMIQLINISYGMTMGVNLLAKIFLKIMDLT